MKAKAGEYVVLLSTCNGKVDIWLPGIPLNYIYQLRLDANINNFYVIKDHVGSSNNGWGWNEYKDSQLAWRLATPAEIAAYKENNGPIHIDKVKQLDYEIY